MKKEPNVFVDALSKELQINAVHVNVAQEYIMITEDKTYRCLTEWKKKVEYRESWVAPVTLLSSLMLAFVTADFKDAFSIPKDTWRAIFMIGMLMSSVWAVKALVGFFRHSGNPTVEELLDQLKKGAVVQKTTVDAVKTEALSR